MRVKKIVAVVMSGLIAVSVGAFSSACSGGDDKGDKTKTQLYVGDCSNGYGTDWLEQIADKFEEKFKDRSFEEGKMGVEVKLTHSGSQYVGTTYINNISGDRTEVIFSEVAYYTDYASRGLLADISDIYDVPLTEFGETRSIKDKLDGQYHEYLDYQGKVYALPWWSGIQGISYDVDLFEDKGLFFAKNGAPSEAFVEGGSFDGNYKFTGENDKSAGPDNKYGTYDDGLPVTYEEFFKMCDNMYKNNSITPFIWTGQYEGYADMLFKSLWTNNDGFDTCRALYEYDGQLKTIIDADTVEYNADGTLKYEGNNPKVTILTDDGKDYLTVNNANGYEVQSTLGKLQALDFAKRLVNNASYVTKQSYSGTNSHTTTQSLFLKGKNTASLDTVAMLVDGSWWINEAEGSGAFNETDGTKLTRNIAFMPLPFATQDVAIARDYKQTISSYRYAYSFINGNCKGEKLDLAKLFFKYCHSDEALKIFNSASSAIRPLDFTYSDEEYKALNPFARSMYDLSKSYNIVYPVSTNKMFLNSMSFFGDPSYGAYAEIGGNEYNKVTFFFKNNPSANVKDYFKGGVDYYKNRWNKYIKDFV